MNKQESKCDNRDMKTECYNCINRRNVPFNTHIACINPDLKMRANQHGIKNGWFWYPLLFDPI